MTVEITPKKLSGKVSAPSSKSAAHRALICAAFADGVSELKIDGISEDIKATVRCLEQLGTEIIIDGNNITVVPSEKYPEKAEFDCGESGSTLRFFVCIAAALGVEATFFMRGRLAERPMDTLLDVLEAHGIKTDRKNPLKISGKLESGDYKIAGNVSSQFVTGLLFALSFCGGTLEVTEPIESENYIDLTLSVMRSFGAEIEKEKNSFKINQKKSIAHNEKIEGDWTNGAVLIALGAEVGNLNKNSAQGDRIFSEFFENFPSEIDAKNIPDLVPLLAVIAASKKQTTTIKNASRLRLKESDRIFTTVTLINSLGGKAEETDDGMIIYGSGFLRGGTVDSFGDHRIVMAAAAAAQWCAEKVVITGAEAVNKSFPDFFKIYNQLGGAANVVQLR